MSVSNTLRCNVDFNLPVDHVQLVEVLQGEQELSTVETAALFIEPLFTLQVVEQLSTIDETEPRLAPGPLT